MKRKTVIYEIQDNFAFPEKQGFGRCNGCPCLSVNGIESWCGLYEKRHGFDKDCPFHDSDEVTIEIDKNFNKNWKR